MTRHKLVTALAGVTLLAGLVAAQDARDKPQKLELGKTASVSFSTEKPERFYSFAVAKRGPFRLTVVLEKPSDGLYVRIFKGDERSHEYHGIKDLSELHFFPVCEKGEVLVAVQGDPSELKSVKL